MGGKERYSERMRARQVRYRRSPRGRYSEHKTNARARGIAFLLTFEEWWLIWCQSRKWLQRGDRRGQYVMMRDGDEGPYAVWNVFIGLSERNHRESCEKRLGVLRRHTQHATVVTFVECV